MTTYNIGPFQNLVNVHWGAGGTASRPKYILLTLSMTKKGGRILTNDWLDTFYTDRPLVSCSQNDDAAIDALPLGVSTVVDTVGYKVRVLEELTYYAYVEGSGWIIQSVNGGLLSFNKSSMTETESVGSGFGNGRGFSYPYGCPNFSHSTGTDINIVHPYNASAKFKSGTNVKAFYYLTVLDGGPLCYHPFGFSTGAAGWQVYAALSYDGRGAERDISMLPLNATYDGSSLSIVGTRTDTAFQAANGQPVSTFCELLLEVPPVA